MIATVTGVAGGPHHHLHGGAALEKFVRHHHRPVDGAAGLGRPALDDLAIHRNQHLTAEGGVDGRVGTFQMHRDTADWMAPAGLVDLEPHRGPHILVLEVRDLQLLQGSRIGG